MSESRDNVPSPHEKLIQQAEAIMQHVQEQHPPYRMFCEVKLKEALRHVAPYSLSATELGTRLGIPWARDLLKCLALFGEVEKTSNGKYRYRNTESL